MLSNVNFNNISVLDKSTKNDIINDANQICDHIFNFLGTGPSHWGYEIEWNKDIVSSYVWENKIYIDYLPSEILYIENVDIKIPWELNRLHHLVTLSQAWRISKDNKYIIEIFDQIEHWEKCNPFCYGINWVSTMEVSIRVVNIMIAIDLISESKMFNDRIKNIENIITQHGKYIEYNLEIGISDGQIAAGNHLLANFTAMAMIGMMFKNIKDAKKWMNSGINGLHYSMDLMVLNDGFFFESSMNYHRFAIELFLYPYIISQKISYSFEKIYILKLQKMFDLIFFCSESDGTISQIGDGDDGRLLILNNYSTWEKNNFRYLMGIGAVIFNRSDFKDLSSLDPNELIWIFNSNKKYEKLIPRKRKKIATAFKDSGLYVIADDENSNFGLVKLNKPNDGAPTGHSHFDILSIVLSHNNHKVFIDAGSFCYTLDSKKRDFYRSSFCHNIVTINNTELSSMSSDIFAMNWGDIDIEIIKWDTVGEKINLIAQHDGYFKDFGCLVRRSITYDLIKLYWEIEDEIIGDTNKIDSVNSNWLLAPDILTEYEKTQKDNSVIFYDYKSDIKFKFRNQQDLNFEKHVFSPSYGVEKDTQMIRTTFLKVDQKFKASLKIW